MGNGRGVAPVIVTGAAGWLGRRLLHVLDRGADDPVIRQLWQPRSIRCLVLPGQNDASLARVSERVDVLEGDITNPADCARLCEGARGGTLFHTAGVIHPRRVRDFQAVNVGGTENLLQAAAAAGLRRVVVTSSNSPCGNNSAPDQLFDELSPYNPAMGYGRSKMAMELRVQEFQRQGRVETVVIRPPWFYGPFQPPRQTLFFEMVRDGKGPIVGDGNNRRSMVYVDNLCQGLLLAEACARANGQIYWIADERPYPMHEIIDTVERLLEAEFGIDCAHRRLRLPGLASGIAGAVDGALQALGRYAPKVHVLSEMNKTIACSVEKAKRELGYKPVVALEEGMRRSIAWCLSEGLLQRGRTGSRRTSEAS